MAATMAEIAANEWQLRASIVGEMVTSGGIVAAPLPANTTITTASPLSASQRARGRQRPRRRGVVGAVIAIVDPGSAFSVGSVLAIVAFHAATRARSSDTWRRSEQHIATIPSACSSANSES